MADNNPSARNPKMYEQNPWPVDTCTECTNSFDGLQTGTFENHTPNNVAAIPPNGTRPMETGTSGWVLGVPGIE